MSRNASNPSAFYDSNGVLRSWETADPLPEGWTGIALRQDTFFHIGRENGEMAYTALQAKSHTDAMEEVRSRNLSMQAGDEIADPFFDKDISPPRIFSAESVDKAKTLIAAIGTTSRHRQTFAHTDHSEDRCLAEIASSQADLDFALFLRDVYPCREGAEFEARVAGVQRAVMALERVVKIAERLHPGLSDRIPQVHGDSTHEPLDNETLSRSSALDREALMSRIEGDLARLREVCIEPVSLRLTNEIDIEIRPASDDDRVLVGRADWGYTVVNYTAEGLVLDVYAEGELHTAYTACLPADELVSATANSDDFSDRMR